MRSPAPRPPPPSIPGGTVLLALTAACGPTKSTQSTDATSGETTSGDATSGASTTQPPTTGETADPPPAACPEHPTTDACCCFVDLATPDGNHGGIKNTCGSPVLCPTMTFKCTGSVAPDCASELLEATNTAAIDCSLQALADGAVGHLSWAFDDGYYNPSVELELVGDNTVFRHGGYLEDYVHHVDPVLHLSLAPATDYEDCLADPDWRARFECIRQSLNSAPLVTCIEGYGYSLPPGG